MERYNNPNHRVSLCRALSVVCLSAIGFVAGIMAKDTIEDFALNQANVSSYEVVGSTETIIFEIGTAALALSSAAYLASSDE